MIAIMKILIKEHYILIIVGEGYHLHLWLYAGGGRGVVQSLNISMGGGLVIFEYLGGDLVICRKRKGRISRYMKEKRRERLQRQIIREEKTVKLRINR